MRCILLLQWGVQTSTPSDHFTPGDATPSPWQRLARAAMSESWQLRLAFVGIGFGTVASIGVARLIASLLYGTAPNDPFTFAGMLVLLGTVALLAGYIPAYRASRIHPMIALRTN